MIDMFQEEIIAILTIKITGRMTKPTGIITTSGLVEAQNHLSVINIKV